MALKLAMTVSVKAMDSQRWICRTHLFQFIGDLLEYVQKRIARQPLAKVLQENQMTCNPLIGMFWSNVGRSVGCSEQRKNGDSNSPPSHQKPQDPGRPRTC